MSQRSLIQGLVSLTFATLSFIAIVKYLHPSVSNATLWVIGFAGLESLIAFSGLRWSLSRSSKSFLITFFGGMLVRLASLGIVTLILAKLQISPTAPLLGLVGAYFLLSLIQMPFLTSSSSFSPSSVILGDRKPGNHVDVNMDPPLTSAEDDDLRVVAGGVN
jgi:hypothetical protein